LTKESVWSNPDKLRDLQKKKAEIEDILVPFQKLEERVLYLSESSTVLNEKEGELLVEDFSMDINRIKEELETLELRYLLSGEHDKGNAIMEIHPGAGGTESQDWAQMLMRMYLRWAERHGYKTEILDLQYGDEAGIKSATITISGLYAYGYLKSEIGVHRLVRISPFDANRRRHTSFTAVLVYPEIEEDIDIEINEEDLKIDTFRASGAGGQHVNKVSSAVRITHIPTGIVVTCQNERSQHRNRALAMKILKARLYDLKRKEQEEKMESLIGEKREIGWGNQIRSYVLHPYRLVKDHRTGVETGNVDAVLDGDIDMFINAFLKMQAKETSSV
jgi:peptide chain release factor 2